MDEIWAYYRDLAVACGRDPRTGQSTNFSLEFFFCDLVPQQLNSLTRAFLGDETVQLQPTEAPNMETIRRHVSTVKAPYDEQLRAIFRALSYPVSLIQGPPGTGKTETILNLISVIHSLYPEKTIALVSTNNEAINNIAQKIREERAADPMLEELYHCFAELGNRKNIRKWRDRCERAGENVTAIDRRKATVDVAYLQQYPVFSSTVHSLRKIFTAEEPFDNQFDFVIADECSQMSISLGLIAMSCAKNLVLIGDDKQLPPVFTNKMREVSARYHNFPARYKEADEHSFLGLCEEVFPHAPNSFLNRHYRCHPSIIGFCNQYVYDRRLIVATPDDGQFRMRAVWYEGDYCEEITEQLPATDDGQETQTRRKKYNKRQIEIFVQEELPRLLPRLWENAHFSVAVIAPFRAQIEMLSARLQEKMEELGLTRRDIGDNLDDPEQVDIPCLTIHKAQGKGYDVVYLLTTEDYYRENAWSQRRTMVNVAVSRAKQEFGIITAAQWLPADLQRQLTGHLLPCSEPDPQEEGMYCRKLLQYLAARCPTPQGAYGFHRSHITSVFDKVPRYRYLHATGANCDGELSAPARCMADALYTHFGDQYTILSELPLSAIQQTRQVSCPDAVLRTFMQNSRLDFVLCEGNTVRLIIEIDGAQHRKNDPYYTELDQKKDFWIGDLLDSPDALLRIPTDGSTANELETIRRRLEESNCTLTVDEQILRARRLAAGARHQVDMLCERLADKVDEQLAILRAYVARTDIDDQQKRERIELSYARAQNMTYDRLERNSFYLCRYACAYAFEYAMLYELAMRLCLQNGNTTFGALSFGAGSFLDAWSMAYAKGRLTLENAAFDELQLLYRGIDEQQWDTFFIPPQKIFRAGTRTDCPPAAPTEQALCGIFKRVWFYHSSLQEYLQSYILHGPCTLPYNILVFPKIINELQPADVAQLEEIFGRIRLIYPEYYLLVSHSEFRSAESMQVLDRLLGALDDGGEYEICCDLQQMLSADNWNAFAAGWLKDGRLVATADSERYRCYAFAPLPGREGGDPLPRYLDTLNPDFAYDAPRSLLHQLGVEWHLRAEQVRTTSTTLFDVVRLRRRQPAAD